MVEYNIVDADGHLLEPPDLWERYIDPKFRDRAPHMVYEDGMDVFVIEGREFGRMHGGLNRIGAYGERDGKQYPATMRYTDGAKGAFDPHARIKDLDAESIDAAVLYPSLGLFLGAIEDEAL